MPNLSTHTWSPWLLQTLPPAPLTSQSLCPVAIPFTAPVLAPGPVPSPAHSAILLSLPHTSSHQSAPFWPQLGCRATSLPAGAKPSCKPGLEKNSRVVLLWELPPAPVPRDWVEACRPGTRGEKPGPRLCLGRAGQGEKPPWGHKHPKELITKQCCGFETLPVRFTPGTAAEGDTVRCGVAAPGCWIAPPG